MDRRTADGVRGSIRVEAAEVVVELEVEVVMVVLCCAVLGGAVRCCPRLSSAVVRW